MSSGRSLSRYWFEILAYIERKKSIPFSIREISDAVCISGKQVSESINCMIKNCQLKIEHGNISVTAEGLSILEAYRVKRAVILAAGSGTRMMPATADRPKPMVTVNGVRIIDTLLDALVRSEITDITIVRGYQGSKMDELLEKYPFIKFIDNLEYEKSNNISSAILASDKIVDGCYLCEADLYITNPEIITKYQYSSNILGSYSLETDDWSFRMNDGAICDYQKGNTYCYNYYGISYWTHEDCIKLRKDFQSVWSAANGHDYFWEFIPLVLRKENYSVEIRQCRKQDIMEIDNYYELAQLDPAYT